MLSWKLGLDEKDEEEVLFFQEEDEKWRILEGEAEAFLYSLKRKSF